MCNSLSSQLPYTDMFTGNMQLDDNGLHLEGALAAAPLDFGDGLTLDLNNAATPIILDDSSAVCNCPRPQCRTTKNNLSFVSNQLQDSNEALTHARQELTELQLLRASDQSHKSMIDCLQRDNTHRQGLLDQEQQQAASALQRLGEAENLLETYREQIRNFEGLSNSLEQYKHKCTELDNKLRHNEQKLRAAATKYKEAVEMLRAEMERSGKLEDKVAACENRLLKFTNQRGLLKRWITHGEKTSEKLCASSSARPYEVQQLRALVKQTRTELSGGREKSDSLTAHDQLMLLRAMGEELSDDDNDQNEPEPEPVKVKVPTPKQPKPAQRKPVVPKAQPVPIPRHDKSKPSIKPAKTNKLEVSKQNVINNKRMAPTQPEMVAINAKRVNGDNERHVQNETVMELDELVTESNDDHDQLSCSCAADRIQEILHWSTMLLGDYGHLMPKLHPAPSHLSASRRRAPVGLEGSSHDAQEATLRSTARSFVLPRSQTRDNQEEPKAGTSTEVTGPEGDETTDDVADGERAVAAIENESSMPSTSAAQRRLAHGSATTGCHTVDVPSSTTVVKHLEGSDEGKSNKTAIPAVAEQKSERIVAPVVRECSSPPTQPVSTQPKPRHPSLHQPSTTSSSSRIFPTIPNMNSQLLSTLTAKEHFELPSAVRSSSTKRRATAKDSIIEPATVEPNRPTCAANSDDTQISATSSVTVTSAVDPVRSQVIATAQPKEHAVESVVDHHCDRDSSPAPLLIDEAELDSNKLDQSIAPELNVNNKADSDDDCETYLVVRPPSKSTHRRQSGRIQRKAEERHVQRQQSPVKRRLSRRKSKSPSPKRKNLRIVVSDSEDEDDEEELRPASVKTPNVPDRKVARTAGGGSGKEKGSAAVKKAAQSTASPVITPKGSTTANTANAAKSTPKSAAKPSTSTPSTGQSSANPTSAAASTPIGSPQVPAPPVPELSKQERWKLEVARRQQQAAELLASKPRYSKPVMIECSPSVSRKRGRQAKDGAAASRATRKSVGEEGSVPSVNVDTKSEMPAATPSTSTSTTPVTAVTPPAFTVPVRPEAPASKVGRPPVKSTVNKSEDDRRRRVAGHLDRALNRPDSMFTVAASVAADMGALKDGACQLADYIVWYVLVGRAHFTVDLQMAWRDEYVRSHGKLAVPSVLYSATEQRLIGVLAACAQTDRTANTSTSANDLSSLGLCLCRALMAALMRSLITVEQPNCTVCLVRVLLLTSEKLIGCDRHSWLQRMLLCIMDRVSGQPHLLDVQLACLLQVRAACGTETFTALIHHHTLSAHVHLLMCTLSTVTLQKVKKDMYTQYLPELFPEELSDVAVVMQDNVTLCLNIKMRISFHADDLLVVNDKNELWLTRVARGLFSDYWRALGCSCSTSMQWTSTLAQHVLGTANEQIAVMQHFATAAMKADISPSMLTDSANQVVWLSVLMPHVIRHSRQLQFDMAVWADSIAQLISAANRIRGMADIGVKGGDKSIDKGGDKSIDKGGDKSIDKGGDKSIDKGGDKSIDKGGDKDTDDGDWPRLKRATEYLCAQLMSE